MGEQQAIPTQVVWRWNRCHASFSHAGAESQDIAAAQAAAKLLHTRRKKSKRSRVGCRSVFSSPGPRVCRASLEESQGRKSQAAKLWSRLSSRRGVLGLFQSQNSSPNSILPPHKLESRNTNKAFSWEQTKKPGCTASLLRYFRSACMGLSQKFTSLNSYFINF